MTGDGTPGRSVSLRRVAAIVGAILLLVVPTGATLVNSGGLDFLGEDSGLALSRADGPNGRYVEFDADDQLTVNISSEGVNLGSTTRFDRVFVINNTAEEAREVWINHTNPDVISLYDSDTRKPIGFEDRVTLAPGERVVVGILVDTTGPSVALGDSFTSTMTIHSRDLTPVDAPAVDVPDSVDFGDVTNGTLAARTMTISNDGGAPMALEGLSIDGEDASSFSLAGTGALPAVVGPGESVTVSVEVIPTRLGDLGATLSVRTNDTVTPEVEVALTARSVPTELTVIGGGELGFGEVEIDTAVQRSVTLRNDGSTTVDVSDTRLLGADAGAFSVIEAGVLGELSPGETVSVPVVFAPSETGVHEATLEVVTDEGASAATTVTLRGTGIIPADISVSPTIIDYGDVGLNGHAEATLTISNEGEQPLSLDGLRIRGPDADQFSVSSGVAGTTLAAGQSTNVTVNFDPTREGALDAELRITSDDPDTPVRSIPLTGTSLPAVISVEPVALDFGNVAVGSSKTLEVVVRNEESSIADLRVSSTAILGRNRNAFAVTANEAPFTLAPGEQRTVEVTYSPDSAGIKTAQLRILSDGSERQIDVWMANTGWRVRIQEIKPGSRSIDAEEEDFNLDTTRVRDTATNVELDFNDLDDDADVQLNVSTPGTRDRRAGAEEISFRAARGGTFDVNLVHDDEPPLPDSTSFTPEGGRSVLQYITLYHSIENDAFAQPSLTVRVRKANLEPGTDPGDITFRRLEDGEWVAYETELLRESGTHYTLRVLGLPGFSEFVITSPAAEDGAPPSGGGGGAVPAVSETPTGETPTSGVPDERVEVEFEGEGATGEGITVTELDTIPGLGSDEGPLAAIDRGAGPGGDAAAGIGSADRSPELDERIRAAGADALVEVGQPLGLTGSPSVVRAPSGVDGRGQVVRAVDVSVPPSLRDRPATVRFTVDRARFGSSDPATAQVGHYIGTGWQLLPTRVVSVSAESVVVEARTPGFSPFAVFANNQVRFTWELPDGTTLQGSAIEPTFDEPGLHNVTLTVTDAFGRSDAATYRVLANDRPEVDIVAPATIEPGENVTLRADVANEVGNVTVTWLFPDGTEATGGNVTRSFETGAHDVRVTAEDEFGAADEVVRTIPVGPTFGAQQLRSIAANMPFEVQVLLSFLLAVTITFAATRLFGARSGGRRRRPRLPALPFGRSHAPEVLTFSGARLDREGGVFVVGSVSVQDPDGDLASVRLDVVDDRGYVVARKLVELDDAESYEATEETVPVLSRVYIVADADYEVEVTAVDSRGDEAHATITVSGGGG